MSTPRQASASAPRPTKIPRLRPPQSWGQERKTEIQAMQRDINTALKSAFNPHPAQYNRAICILFHFENDDIGVASLEKELEDVFKQGFRYITRRVILKGNVTVQFKEISTWLEKQRYTEEGNLIILVFSGHGELARDSYNRTYLRIGGALNSNKKALVEPTLNWTHCTQALEHAEADVLHILDCSYAAQVAAGYAEVLAATSASEKADSNLNTSFTKALITELEQSYDDVMSVAHLHGTLMRAGEHKGFWYTPYYGERKGRDSCTIRRMQPQGQYHGKSMIQGSKGKGKVKTDDTRVLVGVNVKETFSRADVDGMKKWLLTQVPDFVTGLDIELSGL